jgi:Rrf2 family protein
MISTTAKYALRAVVFLAGYQNGYLSRTEIAKATLVPHDYLLKVLNELDAAGIVESRRGPGGGYRLTSPPERITALEVVLAVDTIPRITECPLGLSGHVKLCPLHKLLDDASRLVEEAFQGATVASLVPGRRPKQSCDFPKTKKQN